MMDILTKDFNEVNFDIDENLDDYFHQYHLIENLYFSSKIDLDTYYETCTLISEKTSNNQQVIDKMKFYVFNNFMIHYNNIKEKEKNQQGDDKTSENMQSNANNLIKSASRNYSSFQPNLNLKNVK